MSLTIYNIILLIIVFLVGLGISVYIYRTTDHYRDEDRKKNIKLAAAHEIFSILLVAGLAIGFNWYNTSTATGVRGYKDFKSEFNNGIYREITITAENGREIFRYEGKFDIERHEDGDDRYLRCETQDGKRYTISYGIQDTVIVIEKDNPAKKE